MSAGFAREDYELAETLSNVTGVRIAPSLAREIAGQWATAKLMQRVKVLNEAGYYDSSVQLILLAEKFERNEA